MGSLGRRGIETRPAASPLMVAATIAEYDAVGFAWPVDHQCISFVGWQFEAHPERDAEYRPAVAGQPPIERRQLVPRQWVRDATAA
jgi:hypothetical protein